MKQEALEALTSDLCDLLWPYRDSGVSDSEIRDIVTNVLDAWEPIPNDT